MRDHPQNGEQSQPSLRRRWVQWLLAGAAILIMIILISPEIVGTTAPDVNSFPRLDISTYDRILVFAPHNDDETIGQGGLIHDALQAGKQVRVVIETNGDGYLFATMEDFRRVFPSAKDFIRMGELRQQESIHALERLGLPRQNITFLSYPDRGTPELWQTNWSHQAPYLSLYIEDRQSPYPLTFDPVANYSGEDLLKNIRTILKDFKPDLVILPNGEDVHPDHRGLSDFSRLAIRMEKEQDSGFQPLVLSYLVHRPEFPEPRGYFPAKSLAPPGPVYRVNTDWISYPINQEAETNKYDAIQQYKSQLPSLRGLLESFVRVNELFSPAVPVKLQQLAGGDLLDPAGWQTLDGNSIPAVQIDPTRDFLTRSAFPSDDLTGLFAAKLENGDIRLCGEVRGIVRSASDYYIRVKVVDGEQLKDLVYYHGYLSRGMAKLDSRGQYFCSTITAQQAGNAQFIMADAEVTVPDTNQSIDQTAWQIIEMKP